MDWGGDGSVDCGAGGVVGAVWKADLPVAGGKVGLFEGGAVADGQEDRDRRD
jgi:hypothetical protein